MTDDAPKRREFSWLLVFAVVFLTVVAGYIVAVLTGYVDATRRLGIVEFGLLVLATGFLIVAKNPQVLEYLQHIKLGQLELDIRKVQGDIDKHRLMLSIILSELQQQILSEAVAGLCNKPGTDDVRTAIRGLADQGLMKRGEKKQIKDISDENRDYNVLEFVRVTAQGQKIHKIVQELLRSI